MVIATYNIWNSSVGMPYREQQLVDEIIKINADVICLQEVPDRNIHDKFAKICKYPFTFFSSHTGEAEGLSILSKYPLEQGYYLAYCAFAVLKIENISIQIANLHLPWNSALERENCILKVIEKIAETQSDYAIIMGDFNCSEKSSVSRYLMGEQSLAGMDVGACWYDLALACAERNGINAPKTLDIQNNPRWKETRSIEISQRFDRILLRNSYPNELPALVTCDVFGKNISPTSNYAASDHYGVWAEINFA